MTKLTVTKIDRHSPQYGHVEFSDGVEASYGSERDGSRVWLSMWNNKRRVQVFKFGRRVDLLKQVLAEELA